jgi:hypothetical protein
LIRDPHGETITYDFKLCPADQQVVYTQRNIAGLVASRFYNGTLRQPKKIPDRELHQRQVDAKGAG